MTRLTEVQMRNMRTKILAGGVVPPRPNLWMNALDRIVRILTLGKGRVVVPDCRAPIQWDGIIRQKFYRRRKMVWTGAYDK